MTARWKAFVVISLFGAALAAILIFSRSIDEIESRTWDWRQRAAPGAQTSGINPGHAVIIIDIDQASLDYLAAEESIFWPWPRSLYGDVVIEFLKRAGARALAFDMLFTEQQFHTIGEDDAFAGALSTSLPVVTAVALRRQGQVGETPESLELFKNRQQEAEQKFQLRERFLSHPLTPRFPGVTLAVDPLLRASALFGNVTGEPDSDGIFRHFVPGGMVGEVPVVSLPIALVLAAGESLPKSISPFQDEQGRLVVRFLGPKRTIPTVPFFQVYDAMRNIMAGVTPKLNLEDFRNTMVLLGTSAPGLLDLRPTPLAEDFPGVEYNATIVHNLVHGMFVKKCTRTGSLLIALAVILVSVALTMFVNRVVLQAVGLLALYGAYGALAYAVVYLAWWIPLAVPVLCSLVSVATAFGFQYGHEGRQHRFIRNAFRYYVSPSVIDRIVRDPTALALGGDRRELSIFFSDIQGFTTISESIDPGRLVHLLNTYLTLMTDTILEAQGTVDKYVGDAVVAFWNAPVTLPDYAYKAVLAALRCQQRLREMSDWFKTEFGITLKTRIGINTGLASVGNFGSKSRFNYTVIGDSANLASRLEGANKYFGTYVLISDSTYERASDLIVCRKIADIRVVGKSSAVGIYEPLGMRNDVLSIESTMLDTFSSALNCFEGGKLDQALELFRTIPKDPVARVYMSRIEKDLERRDPHWSPIWSLTEK